jgi:thymidylate synthase
MTAYANFQSAFLGELRLIVEDGTDIEVRGNLTREVRAHTIEIEDVLNRYIVLSNRSNNVFASIAEGMWLLAGRNDLPYIEAYLRRAPDYSDDGKTWRAGYGPRLRNWNGIDQLAEVLSILKKDLVSRRAVAALYDPYLDFVESRDIPCNNWVHFLARNGRLDMHVAARSIDIWWGFSGVNVFEWSLLLELMAFWLKQEPGRLVFFISSLHLYQRHFDAAQRLLADGARAQLEEAWLPAPRFATDWEDFAPELAEWMRLEERTRNGSKLDELTSSLTDPLLIAYAHMIDLFWRFKRHEEVGELEEVLTKEGHTRLQEAALEFLRRPRGKGR